MGWLVLQYLLPISWLVGLFCKDLLPISWLVLQGFLFCSILVSVGLPPEWALFTCPTFGHHSDLTIQYNQQAEYIHLDTSDLTTISTSHSLQLTDIYVSIDDFECKPQIQKMKTKLAWWQKTSPILQPSPPHTLSFSLMRHLTDISIVLAELQLLLSMASHHRVRARG